MIKKNMTEKEKREVDYKIQFEYLSGYKPSKGGLLEGFMIEKGYKAILPPLESPQSEYFSYCINEVIKRDILSTEDTNKFLLNEGIDIKDRVIYLNDKHERIVDTSVISNPTYWKLGKYDVVSIFKREHFQTMDGKNLDGNPLVYALKGKYKWKWANEGDMKILMQKFVTICKKINQHFDVIIKAPSDNRLLNETMLDFLIPNIRHNLLVKDFFFKINIEDAVHCVDEKTILSDCNNNEQEANIIKKAIYRGIYLEDENGKEPLFISSKNIPKQYVKYVRLVTTKYNKYTFEQVVNMIDGKNILIIDDSISSGQTVSQCVDSIVGTYKPKNVVILTMFSPTSQKKLNYQPYKGKKF